jgi:hypothetical protein
LAMTLTSGRGSNLALLGPLETLSDIMIIFQNASLHHQHHLKSTTFLICNENLTIFIKSPWFEKQGAIYLNLLFVGSCILLWSFMCPFDSDMLSPCEEEAKPTETPCGFWIESWVGKLCKMWISYLVYLCFVSSSPKWR